MGFESTPAQETQLKDTYFNVIKTGVEKLLVEGKIPEEYAAGLLERVGYVEGPFDSVEDATKKGEEFLETIGPIVEFGNQLNLAEKKLNSYSEYINQAEKLANELNLPEEKKSEILKNLQKNKEEVQEFLERIARARSQIR